MIGVCQQNVFKCKEEVANIISVCKFNRANISNECLCNFEIVAYITLSKFLSIVLCLHLLILMNAKIKLEFLLDFDFFTFTD